MLRSSLTLLFTLPLTVYASTDVRKDPDYLSPFADHRWQFQSAVKSVTIDFSSISVNEETGHYHVDGSNTETNTSWTLTYNNSGYALYGNRTSDEAGTLFDNFEVSLTNVAGTTADGHFYTSFYDNSPGIVQTSSERFPVTAARLTGDNTVSCRAEYSPENQTLDVPCVDMTNDDNDTYHVRLQQISNTPLEFRVINIQ